MNIWIEINNLTGQTLKTLDQRKPFDMVEVNVHAVVVRPHLHNVERKIPRKAIDGAYARLVATGEIYRTEIRANFDQFNPNYIAAILAALPDVNYSIRPIRLWVKGKKNV